MLCPICGKTEIYSTDEQEYCIICYFTGRYFENVLESDLRANLLTRIRSLENVVQARVFHYGGGAFNLAIILADGRLVTPGTESEFIGQRVVIPAIPPVGYPWAVMVTRPLEEENEWSGEPTVLPDSVDDDGLVDLVAEIS